MPFVSMLFLSCGILICIVVKILLNLNTLLNHFRSVLVLNGNAADVAKHCVPAVPTKRYMSKNTGTLNL